MKLNAVMLREPKFLHDDVIFGHSMCESHHKINAIAIANSVFSGLILSSV